MQTNYTTVYLPSLSSLLLLQSPPPSPLTLNTPFLQLCPSITLSSPFPLDFEHSLPPAFSPFITLSFSLEPKQSPFPSSLPLLHSPSPSPLSPKTLPSPALSLCYTLLSLPPWPWTHSPQLSPSITLSSPFPLDRMRIKDRWEVRRIGEDEEKKIK